jgi:methyltransferase (TIGR00027 family)
MWHNIRMDSANHEIAHVSDTALMVAAARAVETARPDGLVHDPFAERLAGERGMAILRGLDLSKQLTFGIGMRSRFIDELLLGVLAEDGIDTVLLLGAGLDTRPWRLDLPHDLRWIEVDFPDMLDYKYARLAEAPHCRVERMAADLTDPAGRAAVFVHAGPRTMLFTEGLLMYLPAESVEGIADCAARAGVRRWLMDLNSAAFNKAVGTSAPKAIEDVRAANSLDGTQIWDMLHARGWSSFRQKLYSRDTMATAPERVAELMQARIAAGKPLPERGPSDDPSGVHVFAR